MNNTKKAKQIKKKIQSWNKQGYDISELNRILKNNDDLHYSNKKAIAIILVVIFIAIIAFVYFSIGHMASSSYDSSVITPNMQFVKDTTNNKLTVTSASPTDLLWSDIEIAGDCDTSELSTNLIVGDFIKNCSGTITIRHIPTNTLIGIWEFYNGNNDYKQKFLGSWEWNGNNQTGLWIFYQNNSMESTFTSIGGATNTAWWHFELDESSQICFDQPSDSGLSSGCYDFQFKDNYSILVVTSQGNTAEWHKIR